MEDYVLTAEQHDILFEILVGLILIFAVVQPVVQGILGF